MERYRGLRRHDIVAQLEAAVEASGGAVLSRADPAVAPFEITVRTASGERLELICYGFTANRYGQRGRPVDEHRFQIKYGSEFNRYHELYFDPSGRRVTLMFGAHLEADLFVAVDPRMHSPTWFSSSVEFKERELAAAAAKGWHGWERDRSDARRKRKRPEESLQTETVIAFRPDQFLRYVEFERVASGLDCGERLSLSDRFETGLLRGPDPRSGRRHPLEGQFGLSARDILDVIGGAFRLSAAVRGGVAEYHLKEHLRGLAGISRVNQIGKDGQPDFEVEYRRSRFRIECKNVLARRQRDLPRVDFQKTRAARGFPCSRYYTPDQFHVLAACLHPLSGRWEFRFTSTRRLPEHKTCKSRLSPNVLVTADWRDDVRVILAEVEG